MIRPAIEPRVNDFAIKIATVNGTGSASANSLLMQAIFRMGIPVSGKNIFPSNIQGLPTWYEIRINARGHLARTPEFDLLVAMNNATYARDIAELQPDGFLLYDSTWPLPAALMREDVSFLGVPLAAMCNERFTGVRERLLLKNIAYVGALAALLAVDMAAIEALLDEQYAAKKALRNSNHQAVRLGYEYAQENFSCPLPIRLERIDAGDDHVLLDGNTAAALGCVYAGATVGAWYPITPATSLMDAFRAFCQRFRRNDDGSNRFIILQAEDELAAAGMVIGASWAGARAFTPTSGPGISLMSEFLGLAYYAEVPGVFFDVQRVGPSTGMPTRTQQADLLLCAYASHGDTRHILLWPSDPAECFELAVAAFDIAERYQTPVFVMSDLDIGMNDWRVPRLRWDDGYRPDRGKVLGPEQLAQMQAFYRYLDADGDGIPARTLPGSHPKGAYFTRGSGHTRLGAYTEDSAEYADLMERLVRKLENARSQLPAPIVHRDEGSAIGIVAIGSSHAAVVEALEQLDALGIRADYMRIRAFPFSDDVERFIMAREVTYVVDQNRDGQLQTLITVDTKVLKKRVRSVRYFGGMPLSAHHVVNGILQDREPGSERAMAQPVDSGLEGQL